MMKAPKSQGTLAPYFCTVLRSGPEAVHFHLKVFGQSFLEDVGDVPADEADMVLEAVVAHVLEQALQILDFAVGYAAFGGHGDIAEVAFADIALDDAFGIVGGQADEGHGAGADAALDGTEGFSELRRCRGRRGSPAERHWQRSLGKL